MNVENTLLGDVDVTENPDDSDSTLTFHDWVAQLTPAARNWVRNQQSRSLEAPERQKTILDRLEHIEALLASLVDREQIKDFYSIEEFARMVGKAEFTCREWCRLGRIKATKKSSGRGKYQAWVVSHEELLRYRKEGLLPSPH